MSQLLHVHFLPELIEDDALSDSTAVIIDILRASSTMTTALHNGATRVVPCSNPEDAFHIRSSANSGTILLGGERGGVKIDGFDFGNSPAEYNRATVPGNTVAFTTTNGTRALLKALTAKQILIGAFLNRKAIIDRLSNLPDPTHLICAGTDGLITGEDVLFAGAVVEGLLQNSAARPGTSWVLNDSAEIARGYWHHCAVGANCGGIPSADSAAMSRYIEAAMRNSRGGLNLISLGYGSDIALCSQLDSTAIIPQFDNERKCLFPTE